MNPANKFSQQNNGTSSRTIEIDNDSVLIEVFENTKVLTEKFGISTLYCETSGEMYFFIRK